MNLNVAPQEHPPLQGRVKRTDEPRQVPIPGGGLGGVLLGALLQFGTQYLANKLAPPKVEYVHDGPLIPSLPVRPSVSLPAVEMLPTRPIPTPQPAPSQMIQNRAYQEALNKLNEAKKRNLERKLERNAPRNTSPLLREMTEKSASLASPVLPSQPIISDYQPSLDPAAQVAFQNLLNPASASQPFIQEDQNWIRGNLAYAAKPVSTADYLRNLQARDFARQQAEAQQRLVQEQIQLAQAQRKALQLQQWAAQWQATKLTKPQAVQQGITRARASVSLPSAEYHDRFVGKVDLWKKLQKGEVLSDSEMKQLFHAIDLQKYGGRTEKERRDAEWARLYAEKKLAENMVANAERTETGEILIQGIPVRAEDALYFATQDIQHFQSTDTHLKPEQLLAILPEGEKQQDVVKSTYLSPEEAYRLIQDGKYSQVKNKNISRYFKWGEVFGGIATHSPERDQAVEKIPLATLQNSAQLATVLDELREEYGSFAINTWIRMDSRSFHSPYNGLAADIRAPFSECKRGGRLFQTAKRIEKLRGIGYPTVSNQNALHIDIGVSPGRPFKAGYQFVFIDNGSPVNSNNYAGHYEKLISNEDSKDSR